jgi:hypothetical protein
VSTTFRSHLDPWRDHFWSCRWFSAAADNVKACGGLQQTACLSTDNCAWVPINDVSYCIAMVTWFENFQCPGVETYGSSLNAMGIPPSTGFPATIKLVGASAKIQQAQAGGCALKQANVAHCVKYTDQASCAKDEVCWYNKALAKCTISSASPPSWASYNTAWEFAVSLGSQTGASMLFLNGRCKALAATCTEVTLKDISFPPPLPKRPPLSPPPAVVSAPPPAASTPPAVVAPVPVLQPVKMTPPPPAPSRTSNNLTGFPNSTAQPPAPPEGSWVAQNRTTLISVVTVCGALVLLGLIAAVFLMQRRRRNAQQAAGDVTHAKFWPGAAAAAAGTTGSLVHSPQEHGAAAGAIWYPAADRQSSGGPVPLSAGTTSGSAASGSNGAGVPGPMPPRLPAEQLQQWPQQQAGTAAHTGHTTAGQPGQAGMPARLPANALSARQLQR